MSKTIEQLRAQAAQIEEATRQGENTQIRVGGLFTDVIDFIAQIPITETVLGPLLQALNNSQLIDPSDGQTLTFSIMKDGWTFSDALTQLKLSINGIEQTVTSNYEAFLSVKDQLQREVAATDQRVRNYKTDYDNSQIEYATWKSQTDTQISQYAVAIDKVTGDIISISGRVDTAYDQLDFVTNDLEAADKAIGKIFDLAGMNLSDEPSASWLYKNKDGIYGAAATFDENGNILQDSKLQVTVDGIRLTAENADGRVSMISQTVDAISLSVSTLDGKYSDLKVDVNGISATVNDPDVGNSALKQRADGIDARVTAVDGKYADLKIDVNAISATVNDPNTGIGALNVKADRVSLDLTTLEGQVATMGVKMITVDNIQRTLAEIKANILDFDFTDEWVVKSNGTEVMRLDPSGNLTITGNFYGSFPDGVQIGSKTAKKMWIEDTYLGARLVAKDGTTEALELGFNNFGSGVKAYLSIGGMILGSDSLSWGVYDKLYFSSDTSILTLTSSSTTYRKVLELGARNGKIILRATDGSGSAAMWPTSPSEVDIGGVWMDDDGDLIVRRS